MAQVSFSVKHQIIRRTDTFRVVALSHDYLYAQFDFLTPEWSEVEKTAIFKSDQDTNAYEMLIGQDGTCLVPHEVLEETGNVYVSVFGGSLITVNTATFKVLESGYVDGLESQAPPTPSIYEQILAHMQNLEDVADQAGDAAASAQAAAQSASDAADSALAASGSATSAETYKNAAQGYSEQTQGYVLEAMGYRDQAAASATAADASASRAEQAADNAGYMVIEINNRGHLIYTRTDGVDVDFDIDATGHLVMEA